MNKSLIFLDDEDKIYFLSLFERYLNPDSIQVGYDKTPYKKFNDDIELEAYCLMDNHFHLLIWQGTNTRAMTELMRAVRTSYLQTKNL